MFLTTFLKIVFTYYKAWCVPVWKRKNGLRGIISGTEHVIEQERNVNSNKKPITRKKGNSCCTGYCKYISPLRTKQCPELTDKKLEVREEIR